MSTYWGYRCTKDGAVSAQWFNRGEHILRSCVRCYPLIRQIWVMDDTGYIEVGIMAHAHAEIELFAFLRDHYEHGLELYNEYGRSEPLVESEGTA